MQLVILFQLTHSSYTASRSYFNAYNALIGNDEVDGLNIGIEIEMKSNKRLHQIAQQTQNSYLMYQIILNSMNAHCYLREYLPCANLIDEYQTLRSAKRAYEFQYVLNSGIGECYVQI